MDPLQVKIEVYEGPLDLLLHLVKKNQVDIYDIPIALITEQYLEYLRFMRSLNIDLASEYLLMAATLVHIKSRMLLTSPEDEEKDPRAEITQALLDYVKVKDMAQMLESQEILHRDVFVRHDIEEIVGEENFVFPTLFDLLDALKNVIEASKLTEAVPPSTAEPIKLEEKMAEIYNLLQKEKEILFEKFFLTARTKAEVVVTFVAILHLAKEGLIILYQTSPFAPIHLKLVTEPPKQRHLQVV
jgi:segregation and condensation protein A